MVAKSPESDEDKVSLNKFMQRVIEIAEPVVTNSSFWKILQVANSPLDYDKLKLYVPNPAEVASRRVITQTSPSSSLERKKNQPQTDKKGSSFFTEGFQVSPTNQANKRNRILSMENGGLNKDTNVNEGIFGDKNRMEFANQIGYQGKNLLNYTETIKFFDGYEAEAVNASLDYLLSKHGHTFGINDPIPLNPNQKLTKYPEALIRTRLNPENRDQFRENIKEFAQNPDLQVFKGVQVRDREGRVYLCPKTNIVVAAVTDGEGPDPIIKAQPLGQKQRDILRDQNRMD